MVTLSDSVSRLLILIFLLGTLYGIFGEDVMPGSQAFALLTLVLCAYAGGVLVTYCRLPSLVGMLAVGILYRNLPYLPFNKHISKELASTLRNVSLAVILLKAGLGLDVHKLRTLKMAVFGLSFLPCLLETATITFFSWLLLELPLLWAVMLGFIVSAVSAAVLVPGALSLEEKRLGTGRGIPTLLMAAVSLDNIFALTGFVVVFNILTSNASLGWTLLKRLLEPCIGLALGAACGFLLRYYPKSNQRFATCYRTVLLCFGGLAFTFISKRMEVSGVGALGCVSLAFFASLNWRKDISQYKAITWLTGILWQFIEPFLFGLIGAEVTLDSLQSNLGYGTLVLLCGTLVRVLATAVALVGSGLDWREKIFVSVSWISKATVQAAVGSNALDYARTEKKELAFKEYGNQVLTMSVLAILPTAPLGAIFMELLGTRLLKKEEAENETLSAIGADFNGFKYGSCSQPNDPT